MFRPLSTLDLATDTGVVLVVAVPWHEAFVVQVAVVGVEAECRYRSYGRCLRWC